MTDLARPIPASEIEDLLKRESELDDKQGGIFARMSNKYLVARLYFQMKDYPKALEYAISGLDVAAGPNRGHSVSIQRGRLLDLTARVEAELGDKERAAARLEESFDVLRELMRKEPEEVESRTVLAKVLFESREFIEDAHIKRGRLLEAESLVRGVLNDSSYPAARFLLVRIVAAQADEQNNCDLRKQALAEFERLVVAKQTLPSDGPVIDAIRAKACPAKP